MDVCATLMGFMLRAFGQSVPVNGTFLFLQDDWRSTCCSFVAMYVDCAHKWKVAPTEWGVYGSVPFLHFLQHWPSVRTKVQPRYHPEVRSWEGGLGGNFPHQWSCDTRWHLVTPGDTRWPRDPVTPGCSPARWAPYRAFFCYTGPCGAVLCVVYVGKKCFKSFNHLSILSRLRFLFRLGPALHAHTLLHLIRVSVQGAQKDSSKLWWSLV